MDRPRLVTCNVVSVDGRLTIAPGVQLLTGDQRWDAIAGGADPYAWVRELHDPELLLEGSGSFLASDAPQLPHSPSPATAHEEYGHHLPRDLVAVEGRRWLAVVDGRGRVQLQFAEWPDPDWAGWHALVITSRAAGPEHLAWLRDHGIPYLVVGDGPVDLAGALRAVHDELGVDAVVCTGGGRLGGALLRAGLVDEIDLEVLPAAIGGRGTPSLFDAPPLAPDESAVSLELLSHEASADGHLRLRYAVIRRGSG